MLGAQSYPFETRRQERDEHGQVMMNYLADLRQSAAICGIISGSNTEKQMGV